MTEKAMVIKCFGCGKDIILDKEFWNAVLNHLPLTLTVTHDCGAILFHKPDIEAIEKLFDHSVNTLFIVVGIYRGVFDCAKAFRQQEEADRFKKELEQTSRKQRGYVVTRNLAELE